MTSGSFASSPMILSAGGHDEQPLRRKQLDHRARVGMGGADDGNDRADAERADHREIGTIGHHRLSCWGPGISHRRR